MSTASQKKVLLVIADISGYTEFMVSSKTEIEHSQHVITELIQAIIKEIQIPLEVSKLEGDAVFLYASREDHDHAWDDVTKMVGNRLLQFFTVFHEKLAELGNQDSCHCGACRNIGVLKLKIVAHSGDALFYKIHQFNELSGSDVILVHRLLKNSTVHDEYLLMTESAAADISLPHGTRLEPGREHYEHLGAINTLVCYPFAETG